MKYVQDCHSLVVYHRAEVWSLCWSPNDCKIATCSEDQTVRVWEAGSWVALATLKGHLLAVTSVDWRNICGRSLLVSCSDDRVCLYTTNTITCTCIYNNNYV